MKSSIGSLAKWIVGLGLLASAGCAGSDGGEPKSNGCAPNTAVVCTCPDGVSRGSASCGADGAIGACVGCPAAAAGSGGAAVAGAAAPAGAGGGALPPSMSVAGSGGAGSAGIAGSAGTIASAAGGGGAAGMAGNAGAGSGGRGAAGGSAGAAGTPPAAAGCPAGEMCIAAPLGGVKFCSSDPSAVLPPACPTANQACGTNGKGLCIDAASVGFAGLLFCVYTAC